MALKRKYGLYVVGVVIALFIISISVGLFAYTDAPSFCVRCHVMEEQFISLMKGGLHSTLNCGDCHLPKDNKFRYYYTKGTDGVRHLLVYHSGKVPDNITARHGSKEIIRENCIRCHSSMAPMLSGQTNCWDCHKRTTHRLTGTRETI